MEPLEQDKNVQSVVTFMTGNDRQDMAANTTESVKIDRMILFI